MGIQQYIMIGLGVIILALGVWIGIQKIEIAHKTATIETQKANIENLSRANEILNQNAVAAKQAQDQLAKITTSALAVRKVVSAMPDSVKGGLKNEYMEKVNDCLGAFFVTGVLPKNCSASGTVLPDTPKTGVAKGSRKLPE